MNQIGEKEKTDVVVNVMVVNETSWAEYGVMAGTGFLAAMLLWFLFRAAKKTPNR